MRFCETNFFDEVVRAFDGFSGRYRSFFDV